MLTTKLLCQNSVCSDCIELELNQNRISSRGNRQINVGCCLFDQAKAAENQIDDLVIVAVVTVHVAHTSAAADAAVVVVVDRVDCKGLRDGKTFRNKSMD